MNWTDQGNFVVIIFIGLCIEFMDILSSNLEDNRGICEMSLEIFGTN